MASEVLSFEVPGARTVADGQSWIYPEDVGLGGNGEALAYTQADDAWYAVMGLRPSVTSSATDSLGAFFKSLLPTDERILGVYWMYEGEILRVWTAISEADFKLEQPIYEGQVQFIERMSDLECDFSVIYAQGRELGQLLPTGARVVV